MIFFLKPVPIQPGPLTATVHPRYGPMGKRQFFSLRRRLIWAVGKWESCFWVSTFPPPTVFLSFWSSISFGKVFLELRQDSGKPAATWRDVQLDDHHRFYPRILLHIRN
jgi:hypothetical protein